ncbi:MAG: cell wall metabolism sensor histidine kinase WalK [Clostridiales bacterium]|nr:cell wall metabolism sensor histidine kinase WalK [Clostridiales bacterium]
MFKSTQIKIIIIVVILAIIMFDGAGIIYILNLEKSLDLVQEKDLIINQIQSVKNLLIMVTCSFLFISIVIILFSGKIIMNPLSKLIKNAKLIAAGEDSEVQMIKKENAKSEIDELIDAFNAMTTGLKENLNEVTRQKNQIETLLLHMTDGIVAFNIEGKIIHINPAATRMLKITSKEQNFKEVFENLKIDINMEKEIYLENWTTTEKKVDIDGNYINMFFAPFKDENDRPAGIMVLAQDITEHVKLDNMRKEFVADVSHELKTPLTSIMGYTETLLESEYDKEVQEKFLNVINSEAVRMTKLVSDLLTLSKYDNKKVNWEKTEFDLGELVKECEQNLKIEAEKKEQKIECFVTAEVPLVYADRDGIERVVLNILSNSIKYTNEGGNIKIYVGFVYTDAYIKIIDNGIGIPEKDLSRIFERFYRVDKARTRAMGGTGLGLSIAKEILDNNDGRIDIKSIPQKGTEVVITIPTCQNNKSHI